ncbi:hypothetical protein BJ165DRAFT_1404250 [Panaeolus papilionaceus]|nr:hypothetical protein BJ165DRAFT_1404250 [Panaeolus papilionaceus]
MSDDSLGHIELPEEIEEPEPWQSRGCCAFDKMPDRPPKSRMGPLKAVLVNTERLWDNGQPVGTRIQQEKVKRIVKEWKQYLNLDFKFVTGRNATIRISFDAQTGSWSFLGRDNESIHRNRPTMNFGWVSKDSRITEEDKAVILHEFGHAIGYLHEHQSSRRGEVITLDEEVDNLILLAVIEFYTRTQDWTPEEVRQQILDVYGDEEVSSFSKIDLTSIMMYFMPKEMNLEKIEVPPNNNLSDTDKAYAFINYPYIKTPSPNQGWNIARALDVAGVQGPARERILAEYKEGDWKGMRVEFALWSLNEKAAAIATRLQAKRALQVATTVVK